MNYVKTGTLGGMSKPLRLRRQGQLGSPKMCMWGFSGSGPGELLGVTLLRIKNQHSFS